MAAADWFRNTEWSEQTQRAFWERWGRSRNDFHKAQYLRIQGTLLTASKQAPDIRSGIELLEQVVEQFSDEQTQQATAYVQIGDAFVALGELPNALAAFRSALDAERRLPNARAGAPQRFALFVAAQAEVSLYDEAIRYLDAGSQAGQSSLIVDQFIDRGARAVVLAERDDRHGAKRLAAEAIELAHLRNSGLNRHPGVGLVSLDKPLESALYKRLLALVAGCHDSPSSA